ncbi:unnamed protein product [Tilletia controversa]|uniref:AB hydrolase-1 domain-containing protein n=2 Tax=Tilletia TaxID=13289 RepID=A0A177UN98_9BASI|nr:hypothetical protein CF336_g8617 [Tilletia laevis]KAE8240921.1 hypothetical protein A4X03_0g8260 [Tilletia caries]CAD6905579.1 unnamed protein product [Tilletia controversa]KAE8183488.1 hypothetical protein CF335_g8309 [Tilletia laevis]CAD6891305.1 unnamed protein product [Tilletia caries]
MQPTAAAAIVFSSLLAAAASTSASHISAPSHAHHNLAARLHADGPSSEALADWHARDASTLASGGSNNEGELHTPLTIPAGAKLKNLTIANSNDEIVVYWPQKTHNKKATAAFVMIHGRIRNGNDYWTVMNDALQSALGDGYPGVDSNTIVTAPQFFSTIFNKDQYTSNQLAWADVNAWQAGEVATHPKKTTSSSFDALDAFIDEFSNTSKYPNLKNLTLVGHGGGGQLMARYAMVGKDTPSSLSIRYIVGDPSSNAYFTKDRPSDVPKSVASKKKCPDYNQWRYGYDNFTTYTGLKGKPINFFTQYIQRDVIQIIGYQDVDSSGDQYCMAMLQGGQKRRDRNLSWWRYINTLARTNYDVSGFPGGFEESDLPDWSNISQHEIAHRLIVVENADHDAAKVFGGDEGRAALFGVDNLPTGWRPDGWKVEGTGKYVVGLSNESGKSPSGSGSGKNPSGEAAPVAGSDTAASAAAPGVQVRKGSAVLGGVAISALALVGGVLALLIYVRRNKARSWKAPHWTSVIWTTICPPSDRKKASLPAYIELSQHGTQDTHTHARNPSPR